VISVGYLMSFKSESHLACDKNVYFCVVFHEVNL
jgi:hypothetical protein